MEFFSFYNRPKRKSEKFNNTRQKVYKATYDNKGIRKLVVDKEIDFYEKIQEAAKDTGLTNIFSKYGLSIYDQLSKSEEQLVDLTNLPTNLMEAMSVINEAQYAFDRQSKEVKAKFNNDFKQFIAASETGQLAQVLNEELKVTAERFKTENMANYDNSIQLATHSVQQPVTIPNLSLQGQQGQQATQVVPNTTQNTQQGVNLNV